MRRRSASKRRSKEEVLGPSELEHEPKYAGLSELEHKPKYAELEHKPKYAELQHEPKYSELEHPDQNRDNIPDGVEQRYELSDGTDLVAADNGHLAEMNAMPDSRDRSSSESTGQGAKTIHQH